MKNANYYYLKANEYYHTAIVSSQLAEREPENKSFWLSLAKIDVKIAKRFERMANRLALN